MNSSQNKNDPTKEYIKVIAALNDKPKFLFFPADLIFPCAGITGIVFVLTYIVLGLSLTMFVAISFWLCGTWWILAGAKSYEFTDRLIPLPGKEYFNLNSLFVPATDVGTFKRKMNSKPKARTRTDRKGKKEKIVPFQIESDLHAIMEINFGEDNFAVLLKCNKKEEWSATIPFALEGIHPQLKDSEVLALSDSLSDSLKDIPFGESITFMLGCRSHTRQREGQLDELSSKNQLPLIQLLIASEKLRIKDTTKNGFRQEWKQYAFVTWTQKKQTLRKKSDLLSQFMNLVVSQFNSRARKFAGTFDYYKRNIYIKLAQEIYENSFTPWKMTLGTKAKLNFRPLKSEEIWEDLLWYRFNKDKSPPIPQLIKVSRSGRQFNYKLKVSNSLYPKDTISVLLEGERGKSTCPQHHSRRDIVVVNQELIGAMTLEKAPDGWEIGEQLQWGWKKISDLSVRDTEFFLEISNGNKEKTHDNLIKISKQSTTSNIEAIKAGEGLDVAATLKQDEAIEAQRRLHLGAEPLYAAMVVLVYRENLEELERACNRLANSFSPAKLIRDEKICWKIWTETLLINNLQLLKSTQLFTERRQILDTISVRGLLPITKPKNLHFDGIELVYRGGGYPLHLDLFKNNERAIVTGKAGSGKSVLSFSIVKHALAQGIKVVGIDMSNAGESTFEMATTLLGDKGSYINIVNRSFNILQPPNLSKIPREIQNERVKIWKNSLRSVLVSLAMGQIADHELKERVDSTIVRLLTIFFNDDRIIERYNLAFDNGWKSPQWQNMPVLEDLLFFCSKEKLGLSDCKDIDERAINQINNQIGAKLIDPNIGRAISRPSDIPPDPDMQFFALSGLTNENNSYIMALVAQIACLLISLESPKSLLVMDECSVLFSKHGFSEIVGERFATGRKEGQSVLIISQDIEAIVNCSAKAQILTNNDYWLIGKTTSSSAESYVREVKIPAHIIYPNTSESFQANKQYMYSHWLLCRDDRYWSCRYFPALLELAALANSPDEKAARKRILQKYPNTQLGILQGLGEFAWELSKSFSSDSPLSQIGMEKDEEKYHAA